MEEGATEGPAVWPQTPLLVEARGWAAQPVLGDVTWVRRAHTVHSPCAKVNAVVVVWKRGWERVCETQPGLAHSCPEKEDPGVSWKGN